MVAAVRTGGASAPELEATLAALGRALSDPARVRILALLAKGRSCCAGVARAADDAPGADAICVCELQAVLGMRQSLVSYHLRLLREAGLVREERRGRWSFYSLDRAAVASGAAALAALVGGDPVREEGSVTARPAPAAGGREVEDMAFGRGDPAEQPEGGFTKSAADAGCCGETGCCGDASSAEQASACCVCCEASPAEPACCEGS